MFLLKLNFRISNDLSDNHITQLYSLDLRLTFNYPGTKRALINFSNIIGKIDGRLALSRDVNAFISSTIKDTEETKHIRFNDPIQGIEPVYQEEIPEIYASMQANKQTEPYEDDEVNESLPAGILLKSS